MGAVSPDCYLEHSAAACQARAVDVVEQAVGVQDLEAVLSLFVLLRGGAGPSQAVHPVRGAPRHVPHWPHHSRHHVPDLLPRGAHLLCGCNLCVPHPLLAPLHHVDRVSAGHQGQLQAPAVSRLGGRGGGRHRRDVHVPPAQGAHQAGGAQGLCAHRARGAGGRHRARLLLWADARAGLWARVAAGREPQDPRVAGRAARPLGAAHAAPGAHLHGARQAHPCAQDRARRPRV
mmetsp:Transcript_19764/g.50176  ORF Transcript_19764/g.50176 Transcript_19764/m.50176 type:complete len:232 (-) Transcript_19764:485-1180(-)